jgi:hypothetical protein
MADTVTDTLIADIYSDAVFGRDRATAQLGFSFTPGERSAFIAKATKIVYRQVELLCRNGLIAADTERFTSRDVRLTRNEFEMCWIHARGFAPGPNVTEQVERACAQLEAAQATVKGTEGNAPTGLPEASPGSIFDTVGNDHGAADFYQHRTISVGLLARHCTLGRTELSGCPFPYAMANVQHQRHRDLIGLLYYIPFLVLFTYFFMDNSGGTMGYFAYKGDTDAFVNRLFALGCEGLACTERDVKKLTFGEVQNTTELYRWLSQRVVPGLWRGADEEGAAQPMNYHLFPVGGVRVWQARVSGEEAEWQTDRHLRGFDVSAEEQQVIDTYFNVGDGGNARRYFDANADVAGRISDHPYRQTELDNASDVSPFARDAFTYTPCQQENAPLVWLRGNVGTYRCGGHELHLSFNSTLVQAQTAVADLERFEWVDQQTRGVFVTKVLFSKNAQLFSLSTIGFEISAGGNFRPLRRTTVFQFFRFEGQHPVWFIFYAIFLLMIIIYIVRFVRQMLVDGAKHARDMGRPLSFGLPRLDSFRVALRSAFRALFATGWNLLDIATYVLLCITVIWRIAHWARSPGYSVYSLDGYPSSFDAYAYEESILLYIEGLNAVLLYMKLFKFFKYFRFLNAITRTIGRCINDLLGLLFTAIVLVLAFATAGYIAYSQVLLSFSTFELTLVTILRFLADDFDYAEWELARKFVSPFYLAMLQIFLIIILLNAVTAIIADSFGNVVSEDFDVGAIQTAARADPSCLLTFKRFPPMYEWPMFQELRALALRVLHLVCSPLRCQDDPRRAERLYERSRSDPTLMWRDLKIMLEKVYYGTHLEYEEAVQSLRELTEYIKTVVTDPQGRPLASANPRFTLGLICTGTQEDPRVRSLRSIIDEHFEDDGQHQADEEAHELSVAMLITTFVHLPKYLCRLTRGNSLLELVELRHTWCTTVVGETREANNEPHFDAMKEACDAIGSEAQRAFEASLSMQLPAKEDARSNEDRKALSAAEKIKQELRATALCRGMPASAVVGLLTGSLDEAVYFQQWRRTLFAGEERTGDALSAYVFGRDFNVVRAPDTSIQEVPAPLPLESVNIASTLEWTRRTALSFDLNAREAAKLLAQFKDASGEIRLGLTLEEFCAAWELAFGTALPGRRLHVLNELLAVDDVDDKLAGPTTSQPFPERLIRYEDLKRFCQKSLQTPASRPFHVHLYADVHARFFNQLKFFAYVLLLVCYGFLVSQNFDVGGAYMTSRLRGVVNEPFRSPEFREFSNIGGRVQFEQWLGDSVIEQLYSAEGGFPSRKWSMSNFLVGGIEVRQARGRSQQYCGFPTSASDLVSPYYAGRILAYFPSLCVPRWAAATEMTSSLPRSSALSSLAAAAFNYKKCATTAEVAGEVGFYGCDGYTLFVPGSLNVTEARALVTEVLNEDWLDEHTRVVTVDFFVFNFNYDRFARTQVVFEVSAAGAWVNSVRQDSIAAFDVNHYHSAYYVILAVFLLLLCVNIAVFVGATITGVIHQRREFGTTIAKALANYIFADLWWVLELGVYVLLLSVWALRFATMVEEKNLVRIWDTTSFPDDLVLLTEIQYAILIMEAIGSFFICARIFYFVRLNQRLNILTKTLQLASKNMFSVLILAFVILVGFALAGYTVYGTSVQSMWSVPKAFATLSLTFFGDDDFDNWFMAEVIFTGVYYAFFTIIAVQLMFNMITSVLSNAYDDAKSAQFNYERLNRAIEVDPTTTAPNVSGEWLRYFGVIDETIYGCRLAFAALTGKSDTYRAELRLSNRRSFYREMQNLNHELEFGSPTESARAAACLLRNIALCEKMHAERQRLSGIDDSATATFDVEGVWRRGAGSKDDDEEQVTVFGQRRQSVRALSIELVGDESHCDVLSFWCVELPTRALGESRVFAVSRLLAFHHVWRREFSKLYEETEEEAPLGAKLRAQYNDLDTATRQLTKGIEALLNDQR